MTGKQSIRVIVPEHRLRPVGHVLMTKRAGTHRFKHGRLEAAAHSKGNFDRCSVPVLLIQSFRTFFADRTERDNASSGAKTTAQVSVERLFRQWRHRK